jgi:hypothetical protein
MDACQSFYRFDPEAPGQTWIFLILKMTVENMALSNLVRNDLAIKIVGFPHEPV